MVQKHSEHGADKNLDEIRHTYRHTRWWHTIPPFVGRYRVHNQIALPYSKGYWIGQKQAHTNLDNVEYLKNHLAPEPEQNHKNIYQEDMDFSTYILEGLPKNDKTCVSQNPFMVRLSSFGILLYIYSSAPKSKKLPWIIFFLLMHVLVPCEMGVVGLSQGIIGHIRVKQGCNRL